jgi:hypothetical protein
MTWDTPWGRLPFTLKSGTDKRRQPDMEILGMITEVLIFGAGLIAVYFISITCN